MLDMIGRKLEIVPPRVKQVGVNPSSSQAAQRAHSTPLQVAYGKGNALLAGERECVYGQCDAHTLPRLTL
ncbi:hypothetical protein AA0311_2418 [Asaia bogorensis NBRC 16594]|uniref:Uncharacterized protein n=1 Tax=Asaia bogorensis NBRC 16594 TaxID=1231624 RepID=A0AAN4R0K9_9PROT|nr:hypothetical protein AA0311_2418 [Asaia bogorensis NBRC 16594]GEL52548.1 hypothetical protein ABO01nite_05550 [Asaia bogorensis NBRC 16594]